MLGFWKIFVPTSCMSCVILIEAPVIINFQDQLMKRMAQNRQKPGIIIETASRKNKTLEGNN